MVESFPTLYLEKESLEGLRNYKYAGVDHSLLTRYVYQPFWSWCVELLPLWLAPNLVTLIGFAWPCLNFFLMMYLSPSLTTMGIPAWAHISMAVGLFHYQTLDAIDGKQARRTGTSSPLGELFDHGCDALNVPIGTIALCAALCVGNGPFSLFVLTVCMTPFAIATWEEYHTGILDLPIVNGPSEGLLAVQGVYLLTAIIGTEAVVAPRFAGWSIFEAATALNVVVILGTVVGSVVNVARAMADPDHKVPHRSPVRAFLELVPFMANTCLFAAWAYLSPTALSDAPWAFLMTYGLVFAKYAGRIILARVCIRRLSLFPEVTLFPVALGVLHSYAGNPIVAEVTLVRILCAYMTFAYGVTAVAVISDVTDFLGIRCLVIPHAGDGRNQKKSKRA